MPSIQDAMIRSLQGGLVEELLKRQDTSADDLIDTGLDTLDDYVDIGDASTAAGDAGTTANEISDTANDAKDTVTDVKTAFSSWDNCMQASFCKWPVIAIIVVGSIIIISIVWCIIRCACCGVSCCCECCRCLKCCGNCCGCCDPPRSAKRGKYLDEPYIPPNQGYTSHAPMSMGSKFGGDAGKAPPQYAEFDVSKKGGDDALPEMPSWEGAANKKVMVEEEGVEMDQLKKNPNPNASQTNVALMSAAGSAGPPSPITPNHPRGYGGGNGMNSDPYAASAQNNYNRDPSPYGQPQDQYGMGGVGGPGRRSPGQSPYGNGGGYGQQGSMDSYGRRSPMAQDAYSQRQQPTNPLDMGFQRSTSPQGYDDGYGRQSPAMGGLAPTGAPMRPGPSPQMRRSPGPQGSGYSGQQSYNSGNNGYGDDPGYGGGYAADSYSQPQRSYTGESQRPLQPQRQYTGSSYPGYQMGGGQAGGNAGFDFSSGGYSRPTPPARTGTGESYPGRRAYQPSQQPGW